MNLPLSTPAPQAANGRIMVIKEAPNLPADLALQGHV